MDVGQHFSLDEFCISQQAARFNVDNTPPPGIIVNIKALCEKILDPLREKVGKPIVISSGYRSPRVNQLVGGAKTSQHVKGKAVDFIVPGKTVAEIVELIRQMKLPFDQLIDEFSSWVHVSFESDGPGRQEVLKARKVGQRTVYTKMP